MKEPQFPKAQVHDAGVFYVCHRLAILGWKIIVPASGRIAPEGAQSGIHIVAEDKAGNRQTFLVRACSEREAATIGTTAKSFKANRLIICQRILEYKRIPTSFSLTKDDVDRIEERHEGKGGVRFFVEMRDYEKDEFRLGDDWEKLRPPQ